jgi:hypothetical protein
MTPWLGASAVAAVVRLAATFAENIRRLATLAHQLVDERRGILERRPIRFSAR